MGRDKGRFPLELSQATRHDFIFLICNRSPLPKPRERGQGGGPERYHLVPFILIPRIPPSRSWLRGVVLRATTVRERLISRNGTMYYYIVYLVLTSQFSPHPRPLSHAVGEGGMRVRIRMKSPISSFPGRAWERVSPGSFVFNRARRPLTPYPPLPLWEGGLRGLAGDPAAPLSHSVGEGSAGPQLGAVAARCPLPSPTAWERGRG